MPRFEPSACPVGVPAGAKVDCGYLIVPQDRQQPEGRTIRMAVAILKSRSQNPATDPLVFLAGGPGASALASLGWWLGSPLLDHRDIILLEQRGTHYADPWLDCPEIDAALRDNFGRVEAPGKEVAYVVQAAIQCRDRLVGKGVNLAAYNSAEIASDVEDLRRVRGYDKWNLYGISNGTRLALTVMRDHPAGIRSVVLDSVFPPQSDGYIERLPDFDQALRAVFAACAANPRCRAAYPDLERVFYDVVKRMNARPVSISIHVFPYHLQLTGDDLIAGMHRALYDPSLISFMPLLIYQVHDGNHDVLVPLADESLSFLTGMSRGMLYSVECHDEMPFNDPRILETTVKAYARLGNYLSDDTQAALAICNIWGAGQAGHIETEPVRSDIPTLILSGQHDPITPPRLGELAAETLNHSFVFEFPGQAHGVINDSPCPISMTIAFLNDPTTAPDAGCMSQMRSLTFVTQDNLYVTPAAYRLNTELLRMRDPLHFGVLGFCLLFFLVEVLLLPGNLYRQIRKRSGPTAQKAGLARGLAAATAALNLAFLVGLALAVRDTASANWLMLAFGLPAKAAPLLIIPPLTTVLTIGLLLFAVLAWRRRYWTVVGRVHYSLLTLAALAFIWFLSYWSLLRL